MSGREGTTIACDAQSPSALLRLMLDCRRPALTLASIFLDADRRTYGLAPNYLTFLPAKRLGKTEKLGETGVPDLGSALKQRRGKVTLRASVAAGAIRRIQQAVVHCQKARRIETWFDCYLQDR